MTRRKQIFVPGVGQHDNIGDIILRRELIQWLRPLGQLHVYVGAAPDGYADALEAGQDAVIYYGFASWYRALLKSGLRGRAAYVFKPGEIQLTLKGMKEHIGMLPALLLARLTGGSIARVGVGSRNFSPIPRALMQPSIWLSQLTAWRDTETARYMRGRVMPDLAFGQGHARTDASADEDRSTLVVSMRSDRAFPSTEWISAVKNIAAEHKFQIVTIVQVLRDRERSAALATQLGAEFMDWDGSAPLLHEEALRETYQRTGLVVSDRLHVLIAATTEGASPAALLTDHSDKIDRHFSAAGITGVAASSLSATTDELERHLRKRIGAASDVRMRAAEARSALLAVRGEVEQLVGAAPTSRQRVWHVGRSGEVAGGMTQVVNGYMEWTFDNSTPRLIRSRDGSRGLRALGLFAAATLKLGVKRPTPADVIVVHLSQRGSFVREGLLLRIARQRGFATIAHIHGSEFVSYAHANPSKVRSVLANAHLIMALADATVDTVRDLIPSADVRLIPNAVQGFSSGPKIPAVVFGGAVSERKGVGPLVEAWNLVAPVRPEWHLHIVGPVLDAGLASQKHPSITFTGALPHADLLEHLATASIAVLPSHDEAMPVFLLEAMSNRCAIVSTRVGGIPDLLADGAGVLVDPGDVHALAGALASLMDEPAQREEAAAQAHRRFENRYSMEAVAPELERTWAAARVARWGSSALARHEGTVA